ncbi:MAG: UDP-glucose 4-epimerase GalE [Candidatus Babeliales bacterium]|nr:UDP-glucose 4-epimerase GalE [Candidatus Babeliales bacterium]
MISPTILITGGAGYIGSHTALFMAQKGYRVVILDNKKMDCDWATSIQGDFSDKDILNEIFKQYNIEAVMHLAGYIEVGESVKKPLKFYTNNVSKTVQLLEVMVDNQINKLIFSSSCAIYGIPEFLPVTEEHPKNPVSPYGKSKLMVENLLQDLSETSDLKFVSLRYFNAAGAVPEYGLGEQHFPETHLIPLLLHSAKTGKPFAIFGTDYPTKDGSCIRDYLHAWDIADAHWRALCYLNEDRPSGFFNLGTGTGFSVKEMIQAVENVSKTEIRTIASERRTGDSPILIADSTKAQALLKWKAKCSDLETILRSAYIFDNQLRSKNIIEPNETIII